MIRMSLAELASLIGARLHGGDRVFAGVVADSRKLESGQLFIALRGERVDGHDFVAFKDGALYVSAVDRILRGVPPRPSSSA